MLGNGHLAQYVWICHGWSHMWLSMWKPGVWDENRVWCISDKLYPRAYSPASLRPLVRFAWEIAHFLFTISLHAWKSGNYSLKVLLCTRIGLPYTTCEPEIGASAPYIFFNVTLFQYENCRDLPCSCIIILWNLDQMPSSWQPWARLVKGR